MILKIELTDTEYVATQKALTESYHLLDGTAGSAFLEPIRLELLHLQTLLAEAAAPDRKATA